ncbi:MAG: GerMN domain-containing protein [Agathobacter sp.]|nr:GerMN domain-containing protein [Agathobacter sp.]
MKKKVILTVLAIFMVLMLGACKNEKNQGSYQLFYLNIDGTKLETAYCDPTGEETTQIATDLLDRLKQDPEQSDLRKTIPDSVNVESVVFTGYSLAVDFNQGIYSLPPADEVLLRAAVVKTLVQIKGVSYVNFTVEGEPYKDKNGNLVGSMNTDSFVENPGEQINSSVETTLTLYFANEDGTKLVPEKRNVYYSSNISLEKLVIEKLTSGPKTQGLQPTIPSGTKLITLTVVDGVCYVNLDETFRNQNEEITEQVVLYSIVNSLSELESVDKVQISVNGDTSGKCRYNYDLSVMYEADYSIVAENGTEAEPGTETEEETLETTETETITE